MKNTNWIDYYNKTKNGSPRTTVIKAIEIFEHENSIDSKTAIDLGCGSGVDALELLKSGWSVLAIDSQPAALSMLASNAQELLLNNKLTMYHSSFESLVSLPSVNLIHASFSLPFLHPDHFYQFWEMIVNTLRCLDRFAGSFFGNRDDWSTKSNMTFLTQPLFFNLLNQFEIEFFAEEESDELDALGHIKHWHKYLVIAKKK